MTASVTLQEMLEELISAAEVASEAAYSKWRKDKKDMSMSGSWDDNVNRRNTEVVSAINRFLSRLKTASRMYEEDIQKLK